MKKLKNLLFYIKWMYLKNGVLMITVNRGIILPLLMLIISTYTPISSRLASNPTDNHNRRAENSTGIGQSWHFNRDILRDPLRTKQLLLQEGFEEVTIDSGIPMPGQRTNIGLKGLFLERKDAAGNPTAEATIVFFHGFHPDRKELFAPFVKIAPENCNLLFVDMRSHGETEGVASLTKKVLTGMYGKTEFADVLATCAFVAQKTDRKPQILLGRSTGTLFVTKALLQLKQANALADLHIKGFIFDSGFESIYDAAGSSFTHLKTILGVNPRPSPTSLFSSLLSWVTLPVDYLMSLAISALYRSISYLSGQPGPALEQVTDLKNKIGNLGNLPIMFIHSMDDSYSSFAKINELAQKTPEQNRIFLPIPPERSRHAQHHLYLPGEYKQYLEQFIRFALTYRPTQSNQQQPNQPNQQDQQNQKRPRSNPANNKTAPSDSHHKDPTSSNTDLGKIDKLNKRTQIQKKIPRKNRFLGGGFSTNRETPRYIPETGGQNSGSGNTGGVGGYGNPGRPYNYGNPSRGYPNRGFGSPNFDNPIWTGSQGTHNKNKATQSYNEPLYLDDYHHDPEIMDQPDPIIKRVKKNHIQR